MFAVVASLLTAGLVGVAAPASAAVAITLTAGSGTMGVAQTLSATVDAGALGAPAGTVTFTANGQSVGSKAVGGSSGSTADVAWTPSAVGTIGIQARFVSTDGTQQATDSESVQVARVDTGTSLSAPGSAGVGAAITLTARVASTQGAYQPTGSVTFLLRSGTPVGSANLDATGKAVFSYTTPATSQTVQIYASYAGDGHANDSKSSIASITVSGKATTTTLVLPHPAYADTSVLLTAKVTPTTATGTVDFSVDGKPLASVRLASGVATHKWVPAAVGKYAVTAKYSGASGLSASTATASIVVSARLKADTITVAPVGAAAWVPSSAVSMDNGDSVQLVTASASGLPVTLSVIGPCQVAAKLLQIKGVGGSCTVTASTAGGNGYAPATQRYGVNIGIGTQTATIPAPASGTYRRGSRLRLGRLSAVTNINQSISWRVIKGGRYCTVYQGAVYYKVKLRRRGTCTVRAFAPAVAGQWSAFRATRTYRVR